MEHLPHITPDLPGEAKQRIKEWRGEGDFHNTFYRILQQPALVTCKNCGDAGFVMISFTRAGPFDSVPNHRFGETITYYGGSEEVGPGWYIISRTISFDCHHCIKSTQKTDVPKVSPAIIHSKLNGITKDKAVRKDLE